MQHRFKTVFVTVVLVFLSLPARCTRKNVLFLMVDDLRPQLGAYTGPEFPFSVHTKSHTPHLDSLASRSILFKRAYVQQAMCGPSRSSILTGRRPDTTQAHCNKCHFREVGGNFTTLPQYFKQHGYKTIEIGKIFHDNDDPFSWTRPYTKVRDDFKSKRYSWRAMPDGKLQNKPLRDRLVADYALQTLRELANTTKSDGRNFFMAAGFYKPHLPFVFPLADMKNYYPESAIRLPGNHYAPVNMPEIAWTGFNEVRKFKDVAIFNITGDINAKLPDRKVLELRRGYYSAVTWIDSLVGEVIKELEDLGLSKDTVISFVSDHGYHLGENGLWGKATNFELSTRVPMMISIPGVTDNGIQTDHLVETVDLFPTLAEAAGLNSLPLCPQYSNDIELCTEGVSLMPLTTDLTCPIKSAAFSQNTRLAKIMGYSIRTTRYRYTEWVAFQKTPNYTLDWNDLSGIELYDHDLDPEENYNIADDVRYEDARRDLSQHLRFGWRSTIGGRQASVVTCSSNNICRSNRWTVFIWFVFMLVHHCK